MLNKQKMNKVNVPPQTISNTIQRSPIINRVFTKNRKGKWSSESLKAVMDVVERGITSLPRASKFWGILVPSFSNHLYGKTKTRKIEPPSVLIEEEDDVIVVCGF